MTRSILSISISPDEIPSPLLVFILSCMVSTLPDGEGGKDGGGHLSRLLGSDEAVAGGAGVLVVLQRVHAAWDAAAGPTAAADSSITRLLFLE
jgi:hypothetical protein